jgi:biotin carboxyl carrier protein
MPKEQGILRRLLVKACPQFLEDWAGRAGSRFRRGLKKVSEYNKEHLKLRDKADEAPSMLWRAAQGAASVQGAKAEADYAKAENDRIDAELRRRTLDPKTRHERADADKAEAEARIAKIKEIQARIELFKQLKEIGVAVTMDEKFALKVTPAKHPPVLDLAQLLTQADNEPVEQNSVLVRAPKDLPCVVYAIPVSVGSRIKTGDLIAEVHSLGSPVTTQHIVAQVDGVVTVVVVVEGEEISPDQPICTILADQQ